MPSWQWISEVVRPSRRPSTTTSYECIVRAHLAPGLGHLPLTRLSPQQVQRFLNAKTEVGLSPRTVAHMRAVLRQALGEAERWRLVQRNVARLAQPPRVPRRPVRPLDADQARVFLGAIAHDRLEPRGKLILVEPKSVTSHRVVALPDAVADGLRRHKARQDREGIRKGTRWLDDPRDLVFRTTVGTPLDCSPSEGGASPHRPGTAQQASRGTSQVSTVSGRPAASDRGRFSRA